jgi:hypothetical protein
MGTIAAANIVLADPAKRNLLRDNYGVKAVEMEGSGIADACWLANSGYLVIRGTCDYCNSIKNDDWHNYAALIAAAFTRTVIEFLPPFDMQAALAPGAEAEILRAEKTRAAGSAMVFANAFSSTPLQPGQVPAGAVRPAKVIIPAQNNATVAVPEDSANLPAEEVRAIETEIAEHPLVSSASDRIKQLTSRIDALISEQRWSQTDVLATELETILRTASSKGGPVTAGWLVLAMLENRRLNVAKASGKTIDVSRLRSLRERAENAAE